MNTLFDTLFAPDPDRDRDPDRGRAALPSSAIIVSQRFSFAMCLCLFALSRLYPTIRTLFEKVLMLEEFLVVTLYSRAAFVVTMPV
ncbi:MAG: hypothetical protein MUE40_21930, partial [Anaerolineae bacterium]|nr:hypothetical protein [Anaerolineae bacterium]